MDISVTIQVASIGNSAGPFDIYYDTGLYPPTVVPGNLLVSGVTTQQLLNGFVVSPVPGTALNILVVDPGTCDTVTVIPIIYPTPPPTPSITPTNTLTPTNTPTATVTPSNTPSATVTPSVTPTNTFTPTPTPTPSITPSITPTLTLTPTVTVTPSPTPTQTKTPLATRTPTPTVTQSPTPTPSPTQTPPPVEVSFNAAVQYSTVLYPGRIYYSINDPDPANISNILGDIPTTQTSYGYIDKITANPGDTIYYYAADSTIYYVNANVQASYNTTGDYTFPTICGIQSITVPYNTSTISIYTVLRVGGSDFFYCF